MSTLPGYEIDVKTKVCIECGEEKPLTIEHYEIWYRSKDGNHMRYANSCKPSRKKHGLKRTLFNVDHDHKTNKVRGIICTYCNNMIARSRDNPKILRNGAKWLEEKNNE